MRSKKFLSLILSMMLIVAMAFHMTGCGNNEAEVQNSQIQTDDITNTASTVQTDEDALADGTVLGEGNMVFTFTVTDAEGNETAFEIHTDKTTVGEALLDLGLIAGEEGAYGLYVKMVNGITADYDVDGSYWAFYINDEMAMTGVDSTEIEEGTVYAFKVEK